MALTDERKLFLAKQEFIRKIGSIETWVQFLSLVNGITSAQLKTLLRNNLQDVVDERADRVAENEQLEIDLIALQDEIDPP